MKGRKRHILVDTQGHLLVVQVHAAHIPDPVGAESVLREGQQRYPGLRKVWADAIYHTDALAVWVAAQWPALDLEIVRRPSGVKGFHLLPRRWVVERTFAGLTAQRLLSKEFERLPWHAESWIRLAAIRTLLKR